MKGFHKAIAILLAASMLVSSAYTSDLAYAAENASVEVPAGESVEELSEEPEETVEEPEETVEEPEES